MPRQTTAYRPTPTNPTTTTTAARTAADVTASEADDWLEEIDSVLEENALEVVRKFVNRGGQ